MEKIVLVTGGAGYIGSHVCKALSQSGFVPVVYDNLCSGNEAAVQWGPLERGDIRDRARLAEVIGKYNPVAVMHFAALIQVGESVKNPSLFYDNNVNGSLCLIEEARLHDIKHIVFSSTAAVYGNSNPGFLKEDSSLSPINPYGQTKLTTENMIRDYADAYDLNYTILRYFNAAGADADAQIGTSYKVDTHLIPLLMRVASNVMPEIKIFGDDYDTADGTAVRDYVHVSDLARAHVLALKNSLDNGAQLTLNLGTNRGFSVMEVIEMARRVTGHAVPAVKHSRRIGDPAVLVANAVKAQKVLKWTPEFSSLENIVETAWAWRCAQNKKRFGVVEVPATWKDPYYTTNDSDFDKRAA